MPTLSEATPDQLSACRNEAQNLFANNAPAHGAMGTIRAWVSDGRSICILRDFGLCL